MGGTIRNAFSIRIGTLFGVDVRAHLTLVACFAWLIIDASRLGTEQTLALMLGLAASLMLHEASHLAAAAALSVPTTSIVLFPFGGIRILGARPSALGEVAIALSGPSISLAVASILWGKTQGSLSSLMGDDATVLEQITLANLALFLVNILPVLPLDGGRIMKGTLGALNVRAPLALSIRISQVSCLACAALSLLIDQPLLLAAAFVLLCGAVQDHVRAESRSLTSHLPLRAVMIPSARMEHFPHGTTVSKAVSIALTSLQPIFPVMVGNNALGIVYREDLIEHVASYQDDYVGSVTMKHVPQLPADATVSEALSTMEETGSPVVIVTDSEGFAGVLLHDLLNERILISALREGRKNTDDTEWSIQP